MVERHGIRFNKLPAASIFAIIVAIMIFAQGSSGSVGMGIVFLLLAVAFASDSRIIAGIIWLIYAIIELVASLTLIRYLSYMLSLYNSYGSYYDSYFSGGGMITAVLVVCIVILVVNLVLTFLMGAFTIKSKKPGKIKAVGIIGMIFMCIFGVLMLIGGGAVMSIGSGYGYGSMISGAVVVGFIEYLCLGLTFLFGAFWVINSDKFAIHFSKGIELTPNKPASSHQAYTGPTTYTSEPMEMATPVEATSNTDKKAQKEDSFNAAFEAYKASQAANVANAADAPETAVGEDAPFEPATPVGFEQATPADFETATPAESVETEAAPVDEQATPANYYSAAPAEETGAFEDVDAELDSEPVIADEIQAEDEVKAPESIDDIFKYKEMLDNGTITEEEFNAKKKEILGL